VQLAGIVKCITVQPKLLAVSLQKRNNAIAVFFPIKKCNKTP